MTDAWLAPTPAQAREILDLAAAAEAVDGVAPLGGHVVDALTSARVTVLLRRTSGGRLVGLAARHDGDTVEVVVHPHDRGLGIGSDLVRAGLTAAGAVWAHGALPAARSVARRLDLRPVRELLRMAGPLRPVTKIPRLAYGVTLRTFRPGRDEAAFLAVNARAFSWHPEQSRLDLSELRTEMAQPWFDPAGFFLAVPRDEPDTILGFHWTKVHSGPQPVGEVFLLGTDPANPAARGLGKVLLDRGLRHLTGLGQDRVMLYVEGDNERALRLYRDVGFEVDRTDLVFAADPPESEKAENAETVGDPDATGPGMPGQHDV